MTNKQTWLLAPHKWEVCFLGHIYQQTHISSNPSASLYQPNKKNYKEKVKEVIYVNQNELIQPIFSQAKSQS